jgi:hypothetical protein
MLFPIPSRVIIIGVVSIARSVVVITICASLKLTTKFPVKDPAM